MKRILLLCGRKLLSPIGQAVVTSQKEVMKSRPEADWDMCSRYFLFDYYITIIIAIIIGSPPMSNAGQRVKSINVLLYSAQRSIKKFFFGIPIFIPYMPPAPPYMYMNRKITKGRKLWITQGRALIHQLTQ